ncbi:MAG: VirB8/TrbF family protein [Succinivibrionaceae bacterium]
MKNNTENLNNNNFDNAKINTNQNSRNDNKIEKIKSKISQRSDEFMYGGRRKGETDNPFLSTRRTWNDYIAAQTASRKLWQTMTCLSMLIALIAVFGCVYNSTKSKYIPYVVEVDKLGHVAPTSGPLQISTFKNQRVIKATLASFIEEARSVTPDVDIQKNYIIRLYNKINSSDPATMKMNDFLNGDPDKNPFKRAETEMVSVEITSILAQSETTYQVEWNEHTRTRTGALKESSHWKALISIYVVDSRDFTEQMIRSNPAGIYVQNFSWTKI